MTDGGVRVSAAIREQAQGPKHPRVATSLENYAAQLRETHREAKAGKRDVRAKAIRAKHGSEPRSE